MARHDAPTSGTGVTRYVVGALLVGALAVVLAVRNSERVDVDLLVWSGEAPIYALAFVAALFGAALAALLTAVWRHRRVALNRERQEAIDLREHAVTPDRDAPTGPESQEHAPSWPNSPPSP